MSRRDRGGCTYDAYLPDPLAGWDLILPGDIAADISDAEAAVRDLDRSGAGHTSLEGLARFLLRTEAVASSRIEGISVAPRRLMDAELLASQRTGDGTPVPLSDQQAAEVLGNVAAMDQAIDVGARSTRLRVGDLLAVHHTLMEASPHPDLGGVVRTTQNWIGGSAYNPCGAEFVPPPPELVADLLEDLVSYVNGDDHPALVQAAIAHAQFETIHPFADGNGRTGRALIHIVLKRRGISDRFVPPISLVLAKRSRDYIGGLTSFRHLGEPTSLERSLAAASWLETFASATTQSCRDAAHYADRIDSLTSHWRERLGRVRSGSATALLVELLPATPIITVESASRLIGRSVVRTGDAVNRLVAAGVLKQRNLGKLRYRVFEADGVVDLFTEMERSLANAS